MLIPINKNPSPREIRNLVITLALVIFVAGTLLSWRHQSFMAACLTCLLSAATGATLGDPKASRSLFRVWMTWASMVGTAISYSVLLLIYFVILTPLSLLFRLMGRDALQLGRKPKESYWLPLEKVTNKESYKHLF